MRLIRVPGVAALVVVASFATASQAASANGSSVVDDEKRRGCNRLSETEFNHVLVQNDSLTLSCPKTCPDLCQWYHGFTPNGNLTLYREGCELRLEPPQWDDLGYFCCACAEEDSNQESCCEAIAYRPRVVDFNVKSNGSRIEGIHVGTHVKLTCTAHGYPNLTAEVLKDERKVKGHELDPNGEWYSCTESVEMLSVTEEDSGEYTCKATVPLGLGGESIPLEAERSLNLVVYKPLNVSRFEQVGSPESNDGNLSYVCEVESTIANYTISWQYGNKTLTVDNVTVVETREGNEHRLTIVRVSGKNNGLYSCVVSTGYRGEEDRRTLGYTVLDGPLDVSTCGESSKITLMWIIPCALGVILACAVLVVCTCIRKKKEAAMPTPTPTPPPTVYRAGNGERVVLILSNKGAYEDGGSEVETDRLARDGLRYRPSN